MEIHRHCKMYLKWDRLVYLAFLSFQGICILTWIFYSCFDSQCINIQNKYSYQLKSISRHCDFHLSLLMIYKIITEIYLVQVMLVAMVYYKIKSKNSLMWGNDCNMQILQTSGKSCHSVCQWKCFTRKVLSSESWLHIQRELQVLCHP